MKMAQKGLTKKQFWVQMTPMFFYLAMGVSWLVMGIEEGKPILWISGVVYLAFVIGMAVWLIIRRKRYPITDEEGDRQAVGALKDGALGMGIVVAIITVGVLLAFGLVSLLK